MGEVIVGLLTDSAIATYKKLPHLNYRQREIVVKNIKYEIWELSNERLNIYDFIEEILIISIPLYPSHKSNENCNLLLNNVDGKNKNKPFSSLKDLIK